MDPENFFGQFFKTNQPGRRRTNRLVPLKIGVREELHTLVCQTCLEHDFSLVEFMEAAVIYGLKSGEIFPVLEARRDARRAEIRKNRSLQNSRLHKMGL